MMALPLSLLLLLWSLASALAQSSSLSSRSSSVSASSVASSGSSTTSGSASGSGSLSASPTNTAAFPSLSSTSECVNNCLGVSIEQVGCDSYVEVDCYCANATTFTQTLVGCVQSQCLGDLASAENISQQFCNVASPSVSLSFSPLPTNSTSNATSSVSSSSHSSSSVPSSAPVTTSATPTSSATGSSTTPAAASPSANVNQSSGASTSYTEVPHLSIVLMVGMSLVLFETFVGC